MSNQSLSFAIADIASAVDNDFNKQQLVGSICYTSSNQMKFTRDKINEVVSQLRDLREHYNGSEAQTSYMEGKLDFIQTLEDQYDEMHTVHEEAQAVYQDLFDKRWTPPAKKSTLDKTQTAAKEAADEVLAKYK